MPRKRLPPDDPREWLNRARSNLAHARHGVPGVYLEDLCFDAQQAAEKALKAVLLHRGVQFPHTHDLARLLTLLKRSGLRLPKYLREIAALTRFAVAARYPALDAPVIRRDYRKAVRRAELALRWAAAQIAKEP